MKRNLSRSLIIALGLVGLLGSIVSCTPECTNIPNESSPRIRAINAMPDQPEVVLYINGHLFNSLNQYTLPLTWGYVSTNEDGTKLAPSSLARMTVLSISRDTLFDTTMVLNPNRHTLIIAGRGYKRSIAELNTKLIMLLDDDADVPSHSDTISYVRYANAALDLPPLDVYFSSTINKDSLPAFTLPYGSATGYLRVPANVQGLIATEHGNQDNVIFTINKTLLSLKGILATIVFRGDRRPLGIEPTPTILLLSDLNGREITEINTFGARFVNGMRTQELNLMPKALKVRSQYGDTGPRNDLPGENALLNIFPGSVTEYVPFNPDTHGISIWYFGSEFSRHDTTHIYSFGPDTCELGKRYTFIALETDLLGSPVALPTHLRLTDSMTSPGKGFGRVRITNLSPDHNISFTIGGKLANMRQKDVLYFDIPAQAGYSLNISDGSVTSTARFDVVEGKPSSVFFLPSQSTTDLPYMTAPN
jgi:hypothetical protein